MSTQDDISRIATENYASASPWPNNDVWHNHTFISEKKTVEAWLSKVATPNTIILNAGSGGMDYETKGTIIHLDIIESYIKTYKHHIVGSVEHIDLPCQSIDGIICVGSVLNYADAQRAIAEFSRILKPNGFFIIEFERSNSAEFLLTKNYGKMIFSKEYNYNNQSHLLWLYSEKHIRNILQTYYLKVCKSKHIHTLSSLIYRLGISESKAAPLSRLDYIFEFMSYPLAHNVMLFGTKELVTKRNNRHNSCYNCKKRTKHGRNIIELWNYTKQKSYYR